MSFSRIRLQHSLRLIIAVASAGLATLTQAQSDTIQFSQGSLIIPMNANYQDACGVVSAYGLVWRLLQANQAGHYFAQRNHIVTVYVSINSLKASPNRCVPSNLSTPPAPSSDPRWNDGCDLAVEIVSPVPNQQPVVPVDYSVPFPTSGLYPNTTIPMINTVGQTMTLAGVDTTTWLFTPKGFSYATPQYAALRLDNTVNPRFTRIQYGGAPFVIGAADAQIVMEFLKNGDTFTPASALAPFITGPFGQCPSIPSRDLHYVQMHQATISFTAPIGRRLNQVPPKIALLDTGAGVGWESGFYPDRALEVYLKMANLYYEDTSGGHLSAAGCPLDSLAKCRRNGSDPDAGLMYPGQIYDEFNSYHDLISRAPPYDHGLLNAVDDGGVPRYRVLWLPHWDVGQYGDFVYVSDAGVTDGGYDPNAGYYYNYDFLSDAGPPNYPEYVVNGDDAGSNQIKNALNNVAYFTGQRGHGLMAECASIGSLEGTSADGGYGMGMHLPNTTPATQFMFSNTTIDNELLGDKLLFDGINCTDPNYASGECMLYRSPANPFSQIGDYHFVKPHGTLWSIGGGPNTNYRGGVSRLAVSWVNALTDPPPADLGAFTPSPGNNRGWDTIDFTFKDNDDRKGAIIYTAGHEYTQSVAGLRIVLGILLNLGWDPIGSERALTAPIGYKDQNIVLAATYTAVNNLPPATTTFTPLQGSFWWFPVSRGHLRAHPVLGSGGLAGGENALDFATLWDVDARMPPPGERNLFTYFGGSVHASSGAPHGVIQDGWIPSTVAGTAIPTGCVDVMALGRLPDNTFGMFPQPGGDGICDLQEALQYTQPNPGTDFGVAERPAYITALQSDLRYTQQMLQVVRGYCFANDTNRDDPPGNAILTPTAAQCNNPALQDNLAHVGGFAHASPAVSPASPNIPDLGASRPTVAFVGALDGQLHAFYMSGGAGYRGSQSTATFRATNVNASTVFARDWAAAFQLGNTPPAGTELWSFMPATQLPMLKANNARVDSSPLVADVFADFSGSGLREWHTVVIANTGGQNHEIFALDVTNPLKPQLLWDLAGSLTLSAPGYPYYSPTLLTKGPDPSGTSGTSLKWYEPTALFQLPPASDPGRSAVPFYDYTDLGSSAALSLGHLRIGTQPLYAVFVATNASGAGTVNKGVETFAIDIATGQKLWQWEEPYVIGTWADNGVPPAVSLLYAADGLSRAYVGDQEGKVWELDPATGVNLNVLSGTADCPAANPCRFPAFSTQSSSTRQQPITTTLALARIPTSASAVTGALGPYLGKTVLIAGTGGASWVSFANPGELHVVLVDDKRLPVTTGGTDILGNPLSPSQAVSLALSNGIMQEPPPFPLSFTGKHLFGSMTVSGQMVFFGAAAVRFPTDLNEMNQTGTVVAGATYAIDLGLISLTATGDSLIPFGGYNLANFGGGVAVFNTGPSENYVIGLEVSKITSTRLASDAHPTPTATLGFTSRGNIIYRLKSWLMRFLR